MNRNDLVKPISVMENMTIEVDTPDGTLFFTIMEENGMPVRVSSQFGKAGTSLAAWAGALDAVVNLALSVGAGLDDIISTLSNINSDRRRPSRGIPVTSGPNGVVVALMEYKREKYKDITKVLGRRGASSRYNDE